MKFNKRNTFFNLYISIIVAIGLRPLIHDDFTYLMTACVLGGVVGAIKGILQAVYKEKDEDDK